MIRVARHVRKSYGGYFDGAVQYFRFKPLKFEVSAISSGPSATGDTRRTMPPPYISRPDYFEKQNRGLVRQVDITELS